jgi:toxin ParE1/3/4
VRIKWLRKALDNMDQAYDYLASENPAAAIGFAGEIEMAMEQLQQFPGSGRPGRVPGTRELVILRYHFLIPYRVQGEEIQILRVFSTHQKPPSNW